ncbi:unnamed protein product [Rhizophagus irregularis]|uniref:Uncharacterized protein n=4 Tax=Rhizophagus irregularis TaxID=588596 RepID=A0A916E816_9GLOM|nr:unnamed protein product [Rhizophagus irregularis]CAB5369817.1 unnamed protein product [Rhizophagus irregularis]
MMTTLGTLNWPIWSILRISRCEKAGYIAYLIQEAINQLFKKQIQIFLPRLNMLLDVFVRQKLEKFVELEFKNSSSDEDIKIKVEKFATNEIEIDSSKPTKPTKKIDKNKYTKKPPAKRSVKEPRKKHQSEHQAARAAQTAQSTRTAQAAQITQAAQTAQAAQTTQTSPFILKKRTCHHLRIEWA